jgi:hypothetical protein
MPTYRTDVPQYQYLYERPAATAFGAGQCMVAGREYTSDGVSWSTPEISFAQFGLPMILPSSGTIGDNGALSGITALNTTYSQCYMYFPAGAIASGSAAGWYYVVMSGTSAGTIYNNTRATTDIPTVPTTLVPFVTTGPGAYTQGTSAVTAFSKTIPGGTLGIHGVLDCYIDHLNNNSAGLKTSSILFGGVLLHNLGSTTSLGQPRRVMVFNRGNQAKQKVTRANITSEASVPSIATTFTTVDTSVDVTLNVTLTVAVATDTVSLEGFIAKLTPAQA